MSYKKNDSQDNSKKELTERYETGLSQNSIPYFDQHEVSEIVDWYASNGNFVQAQAVLDYGLSIHPGSTILLVEQAYLYLDLSKLKEAKLTAESIVDKTDTDVVILKGEIYLNEGNLKAAEEMFFSIDKADLPDIEVIQNVAQLYVTMGYAEKAIEWLAGEFEKHKDNEDFLLLLADCYYQSLEDNDKAIYYYNQLIDKDPYNPEYWMGLSKAYSKINNFEAALEAVDFALVSDEKCGDAYYLKANTYFQLDNMEMAIKYYDKAIDNFGVSPEYGFTLIGMSYLNSSNWVKAIWAFTEAAKNAEWHPVKDKTLLSEIYSNLGLCYSKKGDYSEANRMCARSIKYAPENPFIHVIDGQVKLQQLDAKGAYESWEKACSLLPEVDIFIQISSHLFEAGYIEAAIHYAEKALEVNPEFAEIYNQLATYCLMSKNVEKFFEYNKKATSPIDLNEIEKHLGSLSDEQKQEYNLFIKQVRNIEESNT